MRRPGSSIQALSRFASSLLHFPRHHLCPYCPSVEKGWCVHATQTSQETTAKRKGSNSAGANVPTSRTSRSNQTRVRAARFGSNQHRCMLQQLHRGTPDESRQPLPSQQTRPKRSLALSNPRSTAAGPFLTTPASSLFDPCSHKSCLKHLSLASEGLVRVSYCRPHVLWVLSRKGERKTWVFVCTSYIRVSEQLSPLV
jgi:hypothetical protein